MEKKYIAFHTLLGCLIAGVGLLVATAGLIISFLWLPDTAWVRLPVAVIAYALALRLASLVDKRSVARKKRPQKNAD